MKRERLVGVRKSRRLIEAAQKLMDLMTVLPSEILMKILLRLPVADIMRCKCVCKELLDLITTPEFVESHLSQAIPGLVIYDWETKPYKMVEFVENLDLNSDEGRLGVVRNFNLHFHELKSVPVHSSANGLLFLCKQDSRTEYILSICNPITRDYIKLPLPKENFYRGTGLIYQSNAYGFGVSRISRQYKVVRIHIEKVLYTASSWIHECQVYTVGTGLWRRIASSNKLNCEENGLGGAVLNGNLHWMAHFGINRKIFWISCFDLETELFTTFFLPPCDPFNPVRKLFVLGNCLCLCDNGKYEGGETHIWLMKEYGDHNSWTKEIVIRYVHDIDFFGHHLRPLKIFQDGDILIACGTLLHYSNKTKTIRKINSVFGLDCNVKVRAAIYTPSVVQLKSFAMENVISS